MRINSRTGLAAVTLAMAVLPAVFLAPGATAARTETAGASTAVQLRLPQPTGHFVVGVRDESVSDPSRTDPTTLRPRRLPLRVWYPARSRSHAAPAPYVSAATQAFMEHELGLPTGVFDIDTHAYFDAPARRHVRGVVLVQPGGGSISAFQTGLITDLASHGYAVVSMDIPQESFVVFEADGTPIYQDESFPFDQWRLDARVVLDDLARLVPQSRHQTPIGMFGHSRGGAATIDTMFHEPRVQAGVSLDTGVILFGNEVSAPSGAVEAGLDQPLGLMCSLDAPCSSPNIVELTARLRGAHPQKELDILHNGYSDFVVFNAQAISVDPVVGATLDAWWPTGTVDSVAAGRRAMAAQRHFIVSFMDRHLAHVGDN